MRPSVLAGRPLLTGLIGGLDCETVPAGRLACVEWRASSLSELRAACRMLRGGVVVVMVLLGAVYAFGAVGSGAAGRHEGGPSAGSAPRQAAAGRGPQDVSLQQPPVGVWVAP